MSASRDAENRVRLLWLLGQDVALVRYTQTIVFPRAVLLVFIAVLLRAAHRFLDLGLWAEDGAVFFLEPVLLNSSFLPFHPYSGYLHLAPRIVAGFGDLLSAVWIPYFYLAVELAIKTFCLAEFAHTRYRHVLPSDTLRLAACVTAAGAIDYLGEPGICNLQWFLSLWLLLTFVRPISSRAEGMTVAAGALVCALSAAQPVIAAPLCLWKLRRRPWTSASAVPLAILAGVTIQGAVLWFQYEKSGPSTGVSALVQAVPIAILVRGILPTVAGAGWMERLGLSSPVLVGWLALLVGAGFAAVVVWLWRRDPDLRLSILGCLYLMFASVAVALAGRGLAGDFDRLWAFRNWGQDRYLVLSAAIVLFLLYLAVDRWRPGSARNYFAAMLFLPAAIGNSIDTPLLDGADWRQNTAEIDRYREARRKGQPSRAVEVQINPPGIALRMPLTRPAGVRAAYPPPSDPVSQSRRRVTRPESVGWMRGGLWLVDTNGDRLLQVPPDSFFPYGGLAGDIALTGDWNGDGVTDPAVFRLNRNRQGGYFLLDTDGDRRFSGKDSVCSFPVPDAHGAIPVTGDWKGDGRWKIGLFEKGKWWLDMNGDCAFDPNGDAELDLGQPGDKPVVGDWDGDGRSNIGVVRKGYYWVLDLNGDGKLDRANEPGGDIAFPYGGIAGDIPIAGDWNGTGKTRPGVLRNGNVLVFDTNENNQLDPEGANRDTIFPLNLEAGDAVVAGKW